jgi:hypothetical protein
MNIVLNAGFEIKDGAEFLAEIDDCGSALLFPSNSDVEKVKESENAVLKAMPKRGESLSVYALDGDKTQTVHFYIAQPGAITLSIFDHKGNEVSNIIIHDYQNYGDFYKRIQTSKLEKGVYMVRLQTKENVLSEKMTVL